MVVSGAEEDMAWDVTLFDSCDSDTSPVEEDKLGLSGVEVKCLTNSGALLPPLSMWIRWSHASLAISSRASSESFCTEEAFEV